MSKSHDLEHLREWVGRTESRTDSITAWPAVALAATLDRDDPVPSAGEELPPGWHWLYFLDVKRAAELGDDGHARRGGFLPPVPLPLRMWAGGRIEFHRPLRIGDAARRESAIAAVEPKRGASGDLVFVTVRHTIHASGEVAIIEEHDIVYRERGGSALAARPAPVSARWQRTINADTVLLFRYSALTFNGYRMHYDIDYARNEEHYPGLLVHAPLQVTLLLDLCRRHEPRRLQQLRYRALAPLFHNERFTVNGDVQADGPSIEMWTANAAGHYAMTATAFLA